MERDLDDVDRSVLYLLQQDARNGTTQDIADPIGVSPSTVRNRIDQLEADGIIRGPIQRWTTRRPTSRYK